MTNIQTQTWAEGLAADAKPRATPPMGQYLEKGLWKVTQGRQIHKSQVLEMGPMLLEEEMPRHLPSLSLSHMKTLCEGNHLQTSSIIVLVPDLRVQSLES